MSRPTQRAADGGYAARFLSVFESLSCFRFGGESTLPPTASNADRWAAKLESVDMKSIPPYVFVSFDSSGFSPPVKEEKLAAQKLLALIDEHDIQFSIPEAVLEETSRAPDSVKRIAQAQIYDYDLFNTQDEQRELSEVKMMLFQTVVDLESGKVNDARNLLCAKKYGCFYFVTFDKKHILSKRVQIKSRLGFEVVTPSECLEKLLAYLR